MPDDEQLIALLHQREELGRHGETITPQELCVECPQMLGDVQRALTKLERIDTWLSVTSAECAALQADSSLREGPDSEIDPQQTRPPQSVRSPVRCRILEPCRSVFTHHHQAEASAHLGPLMTSNCVPKSSVARSPALALGALRIVRPRLKLT